MMNDLLNGRCGNDVYLPKNLTMHNCLTKKVKINNSDAQTTAGAEITIPLKHVFNVSIYTYNMCILKRTCIVCMYCLRLTSAYYIPNLRSANHVQLR